MAEFHDNAHRQLFQNVLLIRAILIFCLKQWVRYLDLGTLERAPERRVNVDLVRREMDSMWRVLFCPDEDGAPFPVFFHFEHQLEPQEFMALRMLEYEVLFLRDRHRPGDPRGLRDRVPAGSFALGGFPGADQPIDPAEAGAAGCETTGASSR